MTARMVPCCSPGSSPGHGAQPMAASTSPAPPTTSRAAPSSVDPPPAECPGRLPRNRDDRGAAAGVELPFGLLWLGVTALVVLAFPAWVERTYAARAAAAEAARTVTLADNYDEGLADAQAVADEVADNYGLDSDDLQLEIDGVWERGGEITAHVTVTIPAAQFPGLGSVGAIDHTLSHTDQIDTYRSISHGFSNSEGSAGSTSGSGGP